MKQLPTFKFCLLRRETKHLRGSRASEGHKPPWSYTIWSSWGQWRTYNFLFVIKSQDKIYKFSDDTKGNSKVSTLCRYISPGETSEVIQLGSLTARSEIKAKSLIWEEISTENNVMLHLISIMLQNVSCFHWYFN